MARRLACATAVLLVAAALPAAAMDDTASNERVGIRFGYEGTNDGLHDTFGAGWYYSATSDEIAPFITGLLGGVGDGQGLEFFYNIAVTPNFHLTPDLQVLIPAREQIDTALVLGLRGVLTL